MLGEGYFQSLMCIKIQIPLNLMQKKCFNYKIFENALKKSFLTINNKIYMYVGVGNKNNSIRRKKKLNGVIKAL